ncbi:MAG: hypothetical protein RLZZ420_1324 [Bacteroidota bacterium]|jgi:hypothetical protein
MKFIFTFMFTVNCFLAGSAQQHHSAIKQAAMEMGNALVKKDGDRFLSYMHPSMISLAGGKTQLRLMADSAFKVVEQVGGRVSRISFGNPSPVLQFRNTLQAVISQQMLLTTLLGNAELSSSLIAISADKGKTWTFIDTNLFNVKQIKSAMPDISPELVIPKAAPPKFMLNEQ